jgi:hypothetical protein
MPREIEPATRLEPSWNARVIIPARTSAINSVKPAPGASLPTLFILERIHSILVSNTNSLYSTGLYGQGLTNENRLIRQALRGIRDVLNNGRQAVESPRHRLDE